MATKKKKGMSLEEKRDAILGIFVTTKEVYNLKEIEKLGAQAGVVLQTIKDVLQSLVDDRLVEMEKIGSTNFYWAFPSKAMVVARNRADGFRNQIASDEATIADLEAKLTKLSAGRKDPAAYASRMAELDRLRTEQTTLTKSIQAYAESDPDALAALIAETKTVKAAADRWTDNVWTLKSYLVNHFGKAPDEVDTLMGIPEEFDYI